MHNIIFISDREHKYIEILKKSFKINYVRSIKAAIIYQIEFPAIDGIIYDSDTLDHREILDCLEKINLLNPMVLQIVLGELEVDKQSDTVVKDSNINSIIKRVSNHALNRRESNRATWPIRALYHNPHSFDKKFEGVVLSISIGGCFLKTEHLDLGKPGDIVDMEILFDDFNFLVEGEIIRSQRIADISSPQGFSIKFLNPSPQTKAYIEQIINNRILSMIFSDFSHLDGSKS